LGIPIWSLLARNEGAERKGDDEYLAHPGSKKVSWLFAGWKRLGFELVMLKLCHRFGIGTIRIDEAGT
jgi:hypothetical protein